MTLSAQQFVWMLILMLAAYVLTLAALPAH